MIKRVLILWIILLLFSNTVISAPTSKTNDPKRGWWWYETPPPPEDKEEQKEETVAYPSLKDYTKEELWNMEPEKFRKLIKVFLDKAVQNPTVESVKEYLTLQDIARRKALAFTNVASLVVQTTPELNTLKDAPITHVGKVEMTRMQSEDVERTIRTAVDDFALLYFYSPTCPYCQAQEKVNKMFIGKYGWQIKGIDVTENRLIAEQFGVSTTPTLLLIYRNSDDYLPVALGVLSLYDIERNVMRGIRLLRGEITPEEYNLYEYQRGTAFDPKSILQETRKGGYNAGTPGTANAD
ncbi:MAG: conjugal transfer protein TraF [Nitrospirae bacterium]|nr:MAG: conjugal transfer protein TraF [Nitrospirota bacterium]